MRSFKIGESHVQSTCANARKSHRDPLRAASGCQYFIAAISIFITFSPLLFGTGCSCLAWRWILYPRREMRRVRPRPPSSWRGFHSTRNGATNPQPIGAFCPTASDDAKRRDYSYLVQWCLRVAGRCTFQAHYHLLLPH
jgi:hypothetical protein